MNNEIYQLDVYTSQAHELTVITSPFVETYEVAAPNVYETEVYMGTVGPRGIDWKRVYDNAVIYEINQAVSHNGSSYIKINVAASGQTPPNASHWDVLAEKGASGAGSGDMNTAVYDTNANGIVDNSDALQGNDSAYHLNRGNHTGTQAINSVAGLQTALDGKGDSADVTANTSARHTQGTDTALDTGGANEVTAAEARSHIDDDDLHRTISDGATGNDVLWSGQQISNQLATKGAAADVAANTAKVSNATHTGEVTGSNALTVDPSFVSGKTTAVPDPTDFFIFLDVSANTYRKVEASNVGSGDMQKATYDTNDDGVVNDSDNLEGNGSAYHRNRANHTGTQPISSVSGLQAAIDAKADDVHTHSISDVNGLQSELNSKSTVDQFFELTDTPAGYLFSEDLFVRVNSGGTALIFSPILPGDIDGIDAHIAANTDVAANTAAQHAQNEDIALDQGNANEVTAAELRTHLDDDTKHRIINNAGTGPTDLLGAQEIDNRIAASSGGSITVATLPAATRTCTNTAVTGDTNNTDLPLKFGGGTANAIYTFTDEEIAVGLTGIFDFKPKVRLLGTERVNAHLKIWKQDGASWTLVDGKIDYIIRGLNSFLNGDIDAVFRVSVTSGDVFKVTVQGLVASGQNATLVPAETTLEIVQVGGVKGDPGDDALATTDASDLTTGQLNVLRLPLLAQATSASNNIPGLLHTPGNGVTSANVILGSVLGLLFWIDLSQGPSSCDITMAGAPANSEIITWPGGNVTVATVHTFDPNDRGRYKYFAELAGGIWKLHVIEERKTVTESVQINLEAAGTTAHTAGDAINAIPYQIPAKLDGLRISDISLTIQTAGTTGTEDYVLRRVRSATPTDVATFDIASAATVSGNLNITTASSTNIVATGDLIYIDRDAVHTTPAQGYSYVQITFTEL